eukprot:TRINITY_DN20221_c0_g1_i2.p1 TRINITY_DN20221_c0_g1~~TRINITY_DN20221_c0_g1_i2.p1  ORF type:complete len:962 (+),score=182.88 TRINITY_DN20221_c0_g1_i2:62-2947(+)
MSVLGTYPCGPPEVSGVKRDFPAALCLHRVAKTGHTDEAREDEQWSCDRSSGLPLGEYLRSKSVPHLVNCVLRALSKERPPNPEQYLRMWLRAPDLSVSPLGSHEPLSTELHDYMTGSHVPELITDALAQLDIARPNQPVPFLRQRMRLRAESMRDGCTTPLPGLAAEPRWPHEGPPPQRWVEPLTRRDQAGREAAAAADAAAEETSGTAASPTQSSGAAELTAGFQRLRHFLLTIHSDPRVPIAAPGCRGVSRRPRDEPDASTRPAAERSTTTSPGPGSRVGARWKWYGGGGVAPERMVPWLLKLPALWDRSVIPPAAVVPPGGDATFYSADLVCGAQGHLPRSAGEHHRCCLIDALLVTSERIIAAGEAAAAAERLAAADDDVFCAASVCGSESEKGSKVEPWVEQLSSLRGDDAVEGVIAVCAYTHDLWCETGLREKYTVTRSHGSGLGVLYSGGVVTEAVQGGAGRAAGVRPGLLLLRVGDAELVRGRVRAKPEDITTALSQAPEEFVVEGVELTDAPRCLQLRGAASEILRKWRAPSQRKETQQEGQHLAILRGCAILGPLLWRLDSFIGCVRDAAPPPPPKLPFEVRRLFRWRTESTVLAAPPGHSSGMREQVWGAPPVMRPVGVSPDSWLVVATDTAADVSFAQYPEQPNLPCFVLPSSSCLQILHRSSDSCATVLCDMRYERSWFGVSAVPRPPQESHEMLVDSFAAALRFADSDRQATLPAELSAFLSAPESGWSSGPRAASIVVTGGRDEVEVTARSAAATIARERLAQSEPGRPCRSNAAPPLLVDIESPDMHRAGWLRAAVSQTLFGTDAVGKDGPLADAWRTCRRRPLVIVALVRSRPHSLSDRHLQSGGLDLRPNRSKGVAEWRLVLCLPSARPAVGGVSASAAAAAVGARACITVGRGWLRQSGAWAVGTDDDAARLHGGVLGDGTLLHEGCACGAEDGDAGDGPT